MPISASPEETAAIGADYARDAAVGDVFALIGDLGAGKTQFVKGLVREIGSTTEVTSPTFTLVHEYGGGRCPVYHFDFYRLDAAEAVIRIGFDDYLEGDGICIVEWADRFPQLFPAATVWIALVSKNESERLVEKVERCA
ncbi:tRNA (adenosine(37)-N6)-threonylcarbamoyltransferase complex ATPase subunit type 1 TsaE [soil metagenome]